MKKEIAKKNKKVEKEVKGKKVMKEVKACWFDKVEWELEFSCPYCKQIRHDGSWVTDEMRKKKHP